MATEKNATKNCNGRNGNRKIGLPEKSATKNKRVGKQVGKHKINVCNNGNGKRQRKKPQREKWATKNWVTGKFGNDNNFVLPFFLPF